jgi:hypothetical protein
VLRVRGTLRGKMALGHADWSLSPLAYASVFPGQGLYQGQRDRSAVHGKEKVYGSIP